MTKEAYEWLNKMPFRIVIFGIPNPGCKPAPVLIAYGDLDGDRHFCCWDKTILKHILPESNGIKLFRKQHPSTFSVKKRRRSVV
jgi:hypothetical protein